MLISSNPEHSPELISLVRTRLSAGAELEGHVHRARGRWGNEAGGGPTGLNLALALSLLCLNLRLSLCKEF